MKTKPGGKDDRYYAALSSVRRAMKSVASKSFRFSLKYSLYDVW